MNMPKTIAILAVVLLASVGQASAANILDLPVSLTDTVTHEFDDFFGGDVVDKIGVQLDPSAADLGTVDGITATFDAPSGKKYFVNPPAGKSTTLRFWFQYMAPIAHTTPENWPHTITMLNVEGPAPTLSSSYAVGYIEGSGVHFEALYEVNAPFYFTGFGLSADGPFGSTGVQDYAGAGMLRIWFPNSTDTGQFVTVVPEPATMSLLAMGGLAVLRRRKR